MRTRIAVALAVLFAAAPAGATVLLYIDGPTLVRTSTAVVEGTVESLAVGRDADGGVITDARLHVRRWHIAPSAKGARTNADALPPTLVWRSAGGTVGTYALHVPGAPRPVAGARYLLFLVRERNHNEPWKADDLVFSRGMCQGTFRVFSDNTGTWVIPEAGDATYFDGAKFVAHPIAGRVFAYDDVAAALARAAEASR